MGTHCHPHVEIVHGFDPYFFLPFEVLFAMPLGYIAGRLLAKLRSV
jgi:hypothetical protein